jgi:hypothetical protein
MRSASKPAWRDAARRTDATGNDGHFAAAYNGASLGSEDNERYATRMRQAAEDYARA